MVIDLIEQVRATKELPALPASAVEVLRLTSGGDASASELATVIERDPSLAAKLLKLVNSPLFGVRREVTNVQQAVALAGQRVVRVTALSVSFSEQINAKRSAGFDYESFWRSSLTGAVAARLIARAAAPEIAEEAFIAGLLAQIGRLAAHTVAPDLYARAIETKDRDGCRLRDAERAVFGVTGAALGRALLERWSLPASLCAAVGASQGDEAGLDGPVLRLAEIVRVAYAVSELFCREVGVVELDLVREEVRRLAGLDENAVEAALAAIDTHVRQMARDLSLEIGSTVDYAEIRALAAMEMARLTFEAEHERTATLARAEEAEAEARQLHEDSKHIIRAATTDSLTGIANRAAFEQRLDELLTTPNAAGRVALFMIDVDYFKGFNDTYGHQAGDEVLRAVAAALRDAACGGAIVARWGGEEFIAAGMFGSEADAVEFGERLRAAIAGVCVHWDGAALSVTASIGVALATGGAIAVSAERLIGDADARLYEAKRAGRNRVVATGAMAA